MLSQVEKKVVAAFIAFLRDKLEHNQLDESSAESSDVALQCLVTAFSDLDEAALQPLPPIQDLCQKWEAERSVSPEDEQRAEVLKVEGNELMKTEKYSDALGKYTEALRIKPSPIYHCNRAAAYTKLERYDDAKADCRSALALDPKHSKAYARMGLIHSSRSEHKQAISCYKKASELDPENVSYKNNLSVAEQKLAEGSHGGVGGGMGLGGTTGSGGGMPAGGFPGFPGLGGEGGGLPDLSGILNNPALMNMATQIMSNPEMQSMISSFMGVGVPPGSGGGGGVAGQGGGGGGNAPPPQPAAAGANMQNMSGLLQAGQSMAAQMQQQNPELVEQLRQQFMQHGAGGTQGGGGGTGGNNPNDPDDDNTPGGGQPPGSQNGGSS